MPFSHDVLDIGHQSIVTSAEPDALCAIHRPECAVAIWRRGPMPQGFQSWIDSIASDKLPSTRTIVRSDLVCDELLNACMASGVPTCSERDFWINDASALATIFAQIMQTRYLRLRLDVVRDNACRKFHVDALTARLLCTYRGTGTQYGIAGSEAEPREIHTAQTGEPIVLRGKRWPTVPDSRLVHRSPPIEGSGETRLVLVLDPAANSRDEL